MTRPLRLLILALFLLSGATALVYQVTWLRNLTLIFGTSFQATSILLASFMAGLCLGGFSFGRYSERIARPLRAYGLLELGIAGFAAALPSLLGWVDGLYVDAALSAGGVTSTLTLIRILTAFGLLVPPTFLMGATLPVLTRVLVQRSGEFGTRLSWLYGVNTLGAVIGALLTGFLLIPELGVWRSQLTAAGINVAIGLLAIATDRRIQMASVETSWADHAAGTRREQPSVADHRPPPLDPAQRLGARLATHGAAVSGMCALALEVMWTRGISISVGTTTYSFTVMLAAFLVGIWLGSWLHAVLPLRRISPQVQMGGAMLALGVSSFLASNWIPRLPDLVVQLNVGLFGLAPRIHPTTALLAGFVVMLVPCLFMGIAFPLAGEARSNLGQSFGRSAGYTLGSNTLGSIVGSLLAGFVLIPFMGLQRGMFLAAGVYIAYGSLILAAPLLVAPSRRRWIALGATTTALIAAAWFLPRWIPTWDVRRLGGFHNNQMAFYVNPAGEVNVRDALARAVVLYYREGQASTVSVMDMPMGLGLLINGKAVASDSIQAHQIQLLLGHVPLLAHPDPKKALVIGLGTGITLGSVTAHESLEEITLVEIEPAVLAAQPYYSAVNGNPLADPRLRVHIQDGRNYLKTTGERFDVITADPIHPWNRGSGNLFTAEYYTIASDHLEDRGIMCQWLPAYGLSIANFKSIVATFYSVFPHALLWQNEFETLLTGSKQPIRIDLDRLGIRLSAAPIAEQLSLIGLADPFSFVAEAVLDSEGIREYASGGVINTDDNLHLEFASPFDVGTREARMNSRAINQYRRDPRRDPQFLDLSDSDRVNLDRHRWAKFQTLAIVFGKSSPKQKIRGLSEVLNELPGYGSAQLHLSNTLLQVGIGQLRAGKRDAARRSLERSVQLESRSAEAQRNLGLVFLALGSFEKSIHHLERSSRLRPGRWMTHDGLSRAYLGARRFAEAEESLRRAMAINPNHPVMAARLARLSGKNSAGPIPPRPPRGSGPELEFEGRGSGGVTGDRRLSRPRESVSMALDGEVGRPTTPIPGLERRAAGPDTRGL